MVEWRKRQGLVYPFSGYGRLRAGDAPAACGLKQRLAGDGQKGSPVMDWQMDFPPFATEIPASDDCKDDLGLRWQWQANPNKGRYTE